MSGNILCRYQYDALDRLAAATPLAGATVQRVYQKNRLSVEIQGGMHRRVMQFDDHLLAEQRAAETVLPATDLQRSVLHSVDAQGQRDIAYSPYGHRPSGHDVFSLLGFAGERPDPVTGHYPLGNGYRSYNPVLMRFNQPDSLSPFGEGGLNAYAYCQGDPVNRSDPTGHVLRSLMGRLGMGGVSHQPPAPVQSARSPNPPRDFSVRAGVPFANLTPRLAMKAFQDDELRNIGTLNRTGPSWEKAGSEYTHSPRLERKYIDRLDNSTLRLSAAEEVGRRWHALLDEKNSALNELRLVRKSPESSAKTADLNARREAIRGYSEHGERLENTLGRILRTPEGQSPILHLYRHYRPSAPRPNKVRQPA